jgi:hypothetical protein
LSEIQSGAPDPDQHQNVTDPQHWLLPVCISWLKGSDVIVCVPEVEVLKLGEGAGCEGVGAGGGVHHHRGQEAGPGQTQHSTTPGQDLITKKSFSIGLAISANLHSTSSK